MSFARRSDGSLAFTHPFTTEEQVRVDAYRRDLRLKIAKEAYERARDRYLEMKHLDLERVREEEVLN